MRILPERLRPGDTVALVAPASAPPDPGAIDRSLAALAHMGFRPKPMPQVRRRLGFLAGDDRARADDLMRAFSDRAVKGIFCVRGGYGTGRLLDRLDYALIRRNPKVFIGYSDITCLHAAFLVKANLVSFHGPMMNSDFIKPRVPAFTRLSFRRAVEQNAPAGSIWQDHPRRCPVILRRGRAAGELVGGNLTLLCSLLATPWQPPFRGRILFFEDLDEEPYRYDRLLTQLLNAGLLQQVAGIAIGVNVNCEDPKARRTKEYRQTLADVLRERLCPLHVPVVMNLPFGHIRHNATLPVGGRALLDADRGDLRILAPAVR